MEKRRPGNGLWRRLFSTAWVRSLETVLAVSEGRVGTFLGVCYDRNLAAARKEKARERTVETAFLYRLGVR